MHHESFSKETYIGQSRHISAERKEMRGISQAHIHDFFELEIVIGGSGEQILNGAKYKLGRGSLYLLTPADFHTVTTDSSIELINIMFDEQAVRADMLSELFAIGRGLFLRLSEEDTETLITAADLLIKEMRSAVEERQPIALLEYILTYALREARKSAPNAQGGVADGFSEAMIYIYTSFKNSPPLSRVAAACGYSENYFSTLFKRRTGVSYSDFLNMMKIRYAKFLLHREKSSASEIATACGFSSLSNFYRVFKAVTGVSTSEYRRSLSKG